MSKSDVLIIIIDDLVKDRDPLVVKLRQEYEQVLIFNKSKPGLQFIKENLESRIIIILDIKLAAGDSDGHEILSKIREMSYLIPVIIWSATDERTETFGDFLANKAYAFVKQSTPFTEIIPIIKSAEVSIRTDVASSLEDWIQSHPESKDKPYLISLAGDQYTLDKMLSEIRLQSDLGKEFALKLNKLTIDLLVRNKENLND